VPLAHSDRGRGGHDLERHLRCTASRAAEFAAAFGAAEWASLAGLWHDLGKYDPAFQAYLSKVDNEDGHLEPDMPMGADRPQRGPEHSIAGALHAIEQLGEGNGRVLAWCIAGHHAGLADWNSPDTPQSSLMERLRRGRGNDMLGHARQAPTAASTWRCIACRNE
jgi:CRISPR-associated endonuclease/helicase Cas3